MFHKWNRYLQVLKGSAQRRNYCDTGLPLTVNTWLENMCEMLHPKTMHICDGTIDERETILQELMDTNVLVKMKLQNNCFLCRSDPKDTGRDDSRVFTAAFARENYIPIPDRCTQVPLLGNFMPMSQVDNAIKSRFTKAMRGKKMYVVPFVLGPITGDIKMMGIQITDSGLIALMTTILARSGHEAQVEMQKYLTEYADPCYHKYVKLVHAAGCEPQSPPHWPYNKEKYIIINLPEKGEIWSFGSSHWDNALLVKKGAALQMASVKARKERFYPVNMSVLCVEDPCGNRNIGVMGPTGSGKSVLASMSGRGGSCPVRMKLMSDDISWMIHNPNTGFMHAINPEIGVFPLIKGVSNLKTPSLSALTCSNSIVMNTGSSVDDSAWWEGLDMPDKDKLDIKDWKGKSWLPEGPRAAHLDARFCNSMVNHPNLDGNWESGSGVPLHAVIILTRRNTGFPLVMEVMSWPQGIMHAAAIRTRYHSTPLDNDELHWEPMGARRYLGYNLGRILDTWFSLCNNKKINFPRIFLVNLFLMDNMAKDYMWPGYKTNDCILTWILKRLSCDVKSDECPIGFLPRPHEFDLPCNYPYCFESLFFYDPDFWLLEINKFEYLLRDHMPNDVPDSLCKEIEDLKNRIMPNPCVTCA